MADEPRDWVLFAPGNPVPAGVASADEYPSKAAAWKEFRATRDCAGASEAGGWRLVLMTHGDWSELAPLMQGGAGRPVAMTGANQP